MKTIAAEAQSAARRGARTRGRTIAIIPSQMSHALKGSVRRKVAEVGSDGKQKALFRYRIRSYEL
jgi:hypothetical protein